MIESIKTMITELPIRSKRLISVSSSSYTRELCTWKQETEILNCLVDKCLGNHFFLFYSIP